MRLLCQHIKQSSNVWWSQKATVQRHFHSMRSSPMEGQHVAGVYCDRSFRNGEREFSSVFVLQVMTEIASFACCYNPHEPSLIDYHSSTAFGGQYRPISTTVAQYQTDYYKVLSVAKNCSPKDVKKAYYQLAKKYHPDTNKGDPDASKKFQEVSEAYEILSDEVKRREYDTFGQTTSATGQAQGQAGASGGYTSSPGYTHQWQYSSSINPEDLFRKIFGDMNFEQEYKDYEENKYGFGPSKDVSN